MTFTFSSPVDIVSIYAVEYGAYENTTWTYTPNGGSNSVVTDGMFPESGHTVALNWTGITSFTVTSNIYWTKLGFDDITVDSGDTAAPILSSAARGSNTQIIVTLSEDCQNLIKTNDGGFTVTKTGDLQTYAVSATAQGTDASHVILTVADMAAGAGSGVTVTYAAGGNGTVQDVAGNALETDATGVTVAAWDTTAPTVSSINRQSPSDASTNATSVTYRVTFSEAVTGVDTNDFSLTKTDTADGTVPSVSAVSGSVYDVTVNSISGDGTLRLDLKASGTGIADIGGTAIATGYSGGQTYTIDNTAPTLSSASRDSNTQITVTLSEDCQNLIKANDGGFTVTKTGDAVTYAVSSMTQSTDPSHVVLIVDDMASAGGVGVTVTYAAGGNGTIADLPGNAMGTDTAGVTIAAWDSDAPVIVSAVRNSNTRITVTMSEKCLNVDKPNDGGFTVTKTGTNETYQVFSTAEGSIILTVESMASAGTEGITVTYTAGGNGTVTDLAGHALASDTVGTSIKPWDTKNPETGDPAHPAFWLLVLLISSLFAGGIIRLRYAMGRRK